MTRYVSTRGRVPPVGFGDALLSGLAPDGGLYVPESWPPLDVDHGPGSDRGSGYASAVTSVLSPFVDGSLDRETLGRIAAEAYSTFDHPDVCPLVELGPGLHLLELFHGPTLAFKDVALQLVGRLFSEELARRGERATVVVATSGDTGSAAIAACADRPRLAIVVLHPEGRVSEVQRRQMTTVEADNVHNLAVEGTFDDCQDLVKALFADVELRDELRLSAMNSINWARVAAQLVYYVVAAARVGPCVVAVPTGNFGNVLAGWYARRQGAAIERLVLGSNRNDGLTRWVRTGRLAVTDVVPTLSPSMDIQIPSNLERLVFELVGRDGSAVERLVSRMRSEGGVEIPVDPVFAAASVDDEATLAEMADVHRHHGYLVDPHTAVGLRAAFDAGVLGGDWPVVALATAHPAKFPDAVERATGVRPKLPDVLSDLLERPERYERVPADLDAVRSRIRALVRR